MTFHVLQSLQQVSDSRKLLRKHHLSFLTPKWKSFLRRHRLFPGFNIGDEVKGWDVLKTIEFIQENIEKDVPVLDIGAFGSEVPLILYKLGFKNIHGIDLNPNILKLQSKNNINYTIGDFMKTSFNDSSFGAITSISVIEHGFNAKALLHEMSRLLKSGGFFIASMDYWPNKIDTSKTNLFNMSWTIFSKEEIIDFIKLAKNYGLNLYGETHFDASTKPISFMNQNYTFGWLVLQKI